MEGYTRAMDKLARQREIRNFCRKRRIERLVHFTRTDNLSSIAQLGLLPRRDLANVPAATNDPYRLDNRTEAVCLSIEFPNYKMFYRYRLRHPNVSWSVLELRAELLWELDCAFCWTNAATGEIRDLPLAKLKSPSSLQAMYATQYGEITRDPKIPSSYPTNPQAEVLCFARIPTRYIIGVNFATEEEMLRYREKGISNLPQPRVNTLYFQPRQDYELWRTMKEEYTWPDDLFSSQF